jgi:hypothetical protein
MWFAAAYFYFDFCANRPNDPDTQQGFVYTFECKGPNVYITMADQLLVYGLMCVGWGGGALTIGISLRRRRQVLPHAQFDESFPNETGTPKN